MTKRENNGIINKKGGETMIITKQVEIGIIPKTVNYYKEKGYSIPTKYSEKSKREVIDFNAKIIVRVEDLPETSHVKIKYKCDSCGEVFVTDYKSWKNATYPELGDLCKSCAAKIKLPKAMEDKYGCSNSANVTSIVEKKKQTNLVKYGNEWAIASEQVREIIGESYMQKFGAGNPMQNEVVKQKAKNTNKKRYGGNSPLCSESVKAKSKQTCLNKYGVSNPAKADAVKAKARKTLYKNGNVPSSKAEATMCTILEKMFGKINCFPSYPVGPLSLDCLVKICGEQIDFEYDGCFWHKNRTQQDSARNAVLMNEGYKIVRVKGNNSDTMPSQRQIQEAVDYLVKDNHHIVFIDMNK